MSEFKAHLKSFLKGFLVTLFLMTLIMLSGLAEPRQQAGNKYRGVATGMTIKDESSAPIVARAGISCAWESVGASACNSGYCYANKRTADKVCIDKGYEQSMSYTYNDVGSTSAYSWTGSWTSITADQSDDVAPKGNGGIVETGHGDTSTLSYVLCC